MTEIKKGTILVVDDESVNVNLLEAYLSQDYDIVCAYGGVEALIRVVECNPDLILLDIMMSDMTGYEVCERLKKSEKTKYIPIVMVTALSNIEDRIRGIEVGADDFLTKPLDRLEINTRVNSLLRIKKLHDDLVKETDQAKLYLDMAAVVLLVLDENGDISLISKNGLDVLGYYNEEDIIGNNWYTDHVPERLRPDVIKLFTDFVRGNATFEGYLESPVLTRDGREIIIGWNNVVLLDEGANHKRLLISGTDITERKEAEDKIKRANDYLDNLIKASPIAILSLDYNYNIVTVNKNAADLLGFDAGDLVARPIYTLMETGSLPEFIDREDFEVDFVEAGGSIIPMNVSTSVIEDYDGGQGLIMVMQNLSKLQGLFITPFTEDIEDNSKVSNMELESGFLYISDNLHNLDAYTVFSDLVKQGNPGLCITRMNPESIRSEYGLSKTPFVWLTKNRCGAQQTIDSTELFKIHPTISDFINKVDNGVVLLDGIEYLLLDNDFISILRLIEQSNDTVMGSNSRLILQIDPETLDKKDYHLLKRWMKQLSPNNI
jgi:PAS domain S-box-containing protein